MIVLGINAYHGDSAACLVRDGIIVAAAEEERFNRVKHWAGFPVLSIRYCLEEANITIDDIDFFALSTDPMSSLKKRVTHAISSLVNPIYLLNKASNLARKFDYKADLDFLFGSSVPKRKIINVEHHRAHMFSSLCPSGYGDALLVSIDGFGDFKSGTWGAVSDGQITMDKTVYFPHSMGIFYQAITQFIGFSNYGDEYKVMGLAPYGEPNYVDQLQSLVEVADDGEYSLDLNYFIHHTAKFNYMWREGTPLVGNLFSPKLAKLLGPSRSKNEPLDKRHMDIARSAQVVYERVLLRIVTWLYEKYRLPRLCLAGGCAMNSVANGKLKLETAVQDVYVPPSAGDAGTAIGAALAVCRVGRRNGNSENGSPYLGPHYTDSEITKLIASYRAELDDSGCVVMEITGQDLYETVAKKIAAGQVIGWFQGRMEWGPRALGNRSILGDPRRHDMKDILNIKIKRRESFRPFAPSMLEEHMADWFEVHDAVPYMMKVYQIKAEKREKIPAVCHVDGSGRVQTVSRALNERYYLLISAFYAETGVPMVLNTSFNENEPIVCKPEEAMACFLRTKMDTLVLGNYVIERIGH